MSREAQRNSDLGSTWSPVPGVSRVEPVATYFVPLGKVKCHADEDLPAWF